MTLVIEHSVERKEVWSVSNIQVLLLSLFYLFEIWRSYDGDGGKTCFPQTGGVQFGEWEPGFRKHVQYLLPWSACAILSTTRRSVPESKNIIQSKI